MLGAFVCVVGFFVLVSVADRSNWRVGAQVAYVGIVVGWGYAAWASADVFGVWFIKGKRKPPRGL